MSNTLRSGSKRVLLLVGLVVVFGAAGFFAAAWSAHAKQGKVIKVVAQRFVFTPSEITLKKGETVTLELVTKDVLMGFNAPDFSTRSDIPPGQVMHVTFTPDKTGTFSFLCDVFCGSGHENMNGTIKVVD
jgi:cytochrome c oxidase subunit 2